MGKSISTIYLDHDLREEAKSRGINLSQLVNDVLREKFSGSKDIADVETEQQAIIKDSDRRAELARNILNKIRDERSEISIAEKKALLEARKNKKVSTEMERFRQLDMPLANIAYQELLREKKVTKKMNHYERESAIIARFKKLYKIQYGELP